MFRSAPKRDIPGVAGIIFTGLLAFLVSACSQANAISSVNSTPTSTVVLKPGMGAPITAATPAPSVVPGSSQTTPAQTVTIPGNSTTESTKRFLADAWFIVLSYDQTMLLAAQEGEKHLQVLYQIPEEMGRAQIWFHPADFPTISREGKWVTVIENENTGTSIVARIDLMTGEITPLLEWPGPQFAATISPDGKRVTFLSAEGECLDLKGYAARFWCRNKHVYVMDSDGGNVKRISTEPADRCFLSWSPNNMQLAYAEICNPVDLSITPPRLFVVTLDPDNDPQRVTQLAANGRKGDWSPNGEWLQWFAMDGTYSLSKVNLDGLVTSEVTIGRFGGAWSPDSKQLGAVTEVGITIWNVQNHSVTHTAPLKGVLPSTPQKWLPDGKRLVFSGARVDDQGKVIPDKVERWYVVSIDGTGLIEFEFP